MDCGRIGSGQVLDNPRAVSSHAAAAKVLASLLDKLRQMSDTLTVPENVALEWERSGYVERVSSSKS